MQGIDTYQFNGTGWDNKVVLNRSVDFESVVATRFCEVQVSFNYLGLAGPPACIHALLFSTQDGKLGAADSVSHDGETNDYGDQNSVLSIDYTLWAE